MTSFKLPPISVLKIEWQRFLIKREPDYSIHLVFNDNAWVGPAGATAAARRAARKSPSTVGWRPLSLDSAAAWILRAAKIVDDISLGTSATRHPENRSGLLVYPEAADSFIHYHGFAWRPEVRDTRRDRMFHWQWFEEAWRDTWRRIVPGGTIEMASLSDKYDRTEDILAASSYALKRAKISSTFSEYVISPSSGPMPKRMTGEL